MQYGNINLIDPNDVVSKLPNYINGTPPYEKMYIFAELIAKRRGRSSLISSSIGISQEINGMEDTVNINMLGLDKDSNQFTTKWSKNTALSEAPYEGFGITEINVITNSSFVPQVTINFVDIRGISFANKGNNSPYKILFDFPPPVFQLSLKGYYGKTLTYDLHLVKYNITFEGTTGNYLINAEFVARTFAPLTDVLFKYVEMFPLTEIGTADTPESGDDTFLPNKVNPDVTKTPKNTNDLIKKLGNLYDKIGRERDESELAKRYKKSLANQQQIESVTFEISRFSTRLKEELQNGAILGIIDNSLDEDADQSYFREISSLNIYNTTIKSLQDQALSPNFNQRLYLLINRSPVTTGTTSEQQKQTRDKLIFDSLLKERKYLLRIGNEKVDSSIVNNDNSRDILPTYIGSDNYRPDLIKNSISNIEYYGIDITQYYQKLYKKWIEKKEEVDDNRNELINSINELAFEELGGMKPTIYNMFKIICDDVDKFFDILKRTTQEAEVEHELYKNEILTNPSIKDKKIGAFPNFAEKQTVAKCGGTERLVRRIPDKKYIPNVPVFPEVKLVDDFIKTIIEIDKEESVTNLRTKINPNGNNVWIPITPADSLIYNNLNYDSPYFRLYNNNSDTIINNIYEIVLNRFYISSQYTYAHDFYIQRGKILGLFGEKKLKYEDLIKFVAGAEAVNLSNSLIEKNVLEKLKEDSNTWKTNVNGFYETIKQRNVRGFTNFENNDFLRLNDLELYRNRGNANFNGFKIIDSEEMNNVKVRTSESENSVSDDNVVDKYMKGGATGIFDTIINIIKPTKDAKKEFTSENIAIFSDITENDDYESTFIGSFAYDEIISLHNSFVKSWSNFLGYENYRNRFKEILDANEETVPTTGYTKTAKAFIVASNVSHTLGLINQNKKFNFPALIEVPKYLLAFLGGIVLYNTNSSFKAEIDRFFTTDIGKIFIKSTVLKFNEDIVVSNGLNFITKNTEIVDKLSQNDKVLLLEFFEEFVVESNEFNQIKLNILSLIDLVNGLITTNMSFSEKIKIVNDSIKNNYTAFSKSMNQKFGILNITQLTFFDGVNETTSYLPLSVITGGTTIAGNNISSSTIINANDIYFREFFRVLSNTVDNKIKEVSDADIEYRTSIDDNDIRTQTYYSFKSIADKWVAGTGKNIYGFPFNSENDPSDRLINKFMFVDRAMNDIGDECIINMEPLLDMKKDYDISVFTVLSRLLSINGFEFFPIQNFMSFKENEWEDCFKIFESANITSTPAFVCMYIGGTSSTLNNDTSQYDDDGIQDLRDLNDLSDFKSRECEEDNFNDLVVGRTVTKYPYRQVRAFRVRFSEQNQSFFKNIQIDSREYPETNESLAILSKIARDESGSSPAAIGQNLYNVYENRSYSTTVDMLGNMSIQPTQYFQLENIPIFSGAYMILSVEHSFTPNHSSTSFKGVRILKYPNPIVNSFAKAIGIQSGTAEDPTGIEPPSEPAFGDGGAQTLPTQTNSNSLYTLLIKPN